MPVVVVLLSGRPLILEPILDEADAVVAAWLPGTEGQGVADVLFGDYAPTGKLSFTLAADRSTRSRSTSATRTYEPLFPMALD